MAEKIVEVVGMVAIWLCTVLTSVWGIVQFWAKRWIENRFQKSFEDYKHKHNEEIQRLKCEIDLQLSRVTKIHEKEFEVLPRAWAKLDDLLDLVRQFIRETHALPELDKRSPSELAEFLSKEELTEDAKQRIRNAEYKNDQYFWERSEKAGDACLDFQNYITKNAIFLSSDIKAKFKEAEYTVSTARAKRSTAERSAQRCEFIAEACGIVTEKIPPIMNEIEELVQKRLRFHEA